MTASAHRYTCDQLGACQSRTTPCQGCTPPSACSLTSDPLRLNIGRLHRVDASQMPHGAGVSLGHCRTDLVGTPGNGCTGDCEQGRRCTCTPASTIITSTPHTEPDAPDGERDALLRAWFWWAYIGFLLAVCWGTWQWLSR